MSQLGAYLSEAREARGHTLAEAASATRILPKYLQALEDGDYEQLPGDVYARGFIRNYGQFLDLPADELIQQYRIERGQPTDRIRVMPAAVPPRMRSCLIPSAFFSAFAVLVLLGVLYLLLQWTGLTRQPTVAAGLPTSTPPPATPTEFATATVQPEGSEASALPPTATSEVPPTPEATPVPTINPAVPLTVEIRIAPDTTQGSWMDVLVDGVPLFTRTMAANTTETIKAQREVYVVAGDGSVVELIVNGENRGRMGTVPGGVVKQTITP